MRLRYEKCMTRKAYANPLEKINENYMLLDRQVKRIETSIKLHIKEKKTLMVAKITKLDTLSPLKTLTRGYSIVTNEENKMIKTTKDLNKGDKINLRFIDGERKAEIIN